MKNEISDFIEKLSKQKVDTIRVFNQYHEDDNFPQYFTTKLNLLMYLTQMKERKPKTILVGEAPGKDGCALTGIPFTSLDILSKENRFGLFGMPNIPKIKFKKERTATMIWGSLIEFNFCPLLWNAFPFNPFDPKTEKNRTPNNEEILIGVKYLNAIIKIFDIENVVAVGNTSNSLLTKLKIEHFQVVHPSFGNKTKYYEELQYLLHRKLIE